MTAVRHGADRAQRAVAGAILCGGASSRMGAPKPLVAWHGTAMARLVATALSGAGCDPVRCIGGDATELAPLGLDVVPDLMPGEGPLGGVLTALRSSSRDAVVVVSCDLPRLGAHTVGALLSTWRAGSSHVVAAFTDRAQPLCAVWSASAEPVVASSLDRGERSIRAVLPLLDVSFVTVAAEDLVNVNTPADLGD